MTVAEAEALVCIVAALAAIAGAVVEMRRMGHDQTDTRERLARLEERQAAQAERLAALECRPPASAEPG